jgi:pSer/pThr/pTyr-binding forkhead associated (FHA) protein
VSLNIIYQGKETAVPDGDTVLIGSDAASTIRIVRPGISRKHAVVSFDGTAWKVEDAGSRNGIFVDGQRVQTIIVDEPTTVYLGHPTDGEIMDFDPPAAEPGEEVDEPSSQSDNDSIQAEIDAFVVTETPEASSDPAPTLTTPAPVAVIRTQTAPDVTPSNAELAALTSALRDQISTVKGLTWSVWAMIAVTAVLAVMTLFVGILSN